MEGAAPPDVAAGIAPEPFHDALARIVAARRRYVALNRTIAPEHGAAEADVEPDPTPGGAPAAGALSPEPSSLAPTASAPPSAPAEAFANAFLDALLADPGLQPPAMATAFLAWAADRPAPCDFALVLAATEALRRGDRPAAARHARRAAGLLPNDLHIQRLLRRATGAAELDLRGRFCRAPFESIETAPGGDVHFCCPAWLPVPIGNLGAASPEAIWNSPAAQAIRASIHDGSYRYCSRVHCAHLSADTLPRVEALPTPTLRAAAAARATRLAERPRKLVLAHDRSCTLSCPSCRTKVIVARGAELAALDRLTETVLLPLARDAAQVRVTSSGDPFGSRHFRRLIKRLTREDFPGLRLDIQTNGVLFDAEAWEELDLAGRLSQVAISLDAASRETYDIVRRGGDFARLLANLAFLGERRRAGEIARMRLDFVVQAANFREMPAMPAIARRYGFDGVKFQMIRNWNTWADFAAQDIGAPGHPERGAFLAILGDPALQGAGIEFWGMREALEAARPPLPAARFERISAR